MNHVALVAVALGWASLPVPATPATAAPVTAAAQRAFVTGGWVEGVRAGDALVFRGIPYAAPPLGRLRWAPPQPVRRWSGTRDARHAAPACPQNDYGWNAGDAAHASEDCLTLDVRTPSMTGKRPVMLWIHGGSNLAGSARGTVESRITDGGVVLVAIQYRLGILGFLAHRGAADAKGHAGNYGLMDQIAALRWVKRNIARFGGDPANVTIFGESAGAEDVSLLLAAPAARGLFARAAMQSGTPGFGMPFRPLREALALGDQADQLLGAGGSIARMRQAPVAALLAADLKLRDPVITDPASVWNTMTWLRTQIDGAVLPESPRALLAKAPPRPVLIGSSRAEFGPAKGSIDLAAAIAFGFGDKAGTARSLYRFDEPARAADPRLGHPALELSTDLIFRCPTGTLSTLLAKQGWPVWRYEFDLAKDGGLSSHGSELPYLFDGLSFAGGISLQRYWLDFAATGDPNGARGQPAWPHFDAASARYVAINARGVHVRSHLRQPICSLLETL
ncbi:carboxylesterase/lipase family protein [Sphingomonas sp. RS6]